MIYEYECKLGHRFEISCALKDFKSKRKCPECKKQAGIRISAVKGYVSRDCNYDCPITGKPITSYAQHRDNLARNHCQEYDPEMKTDAANFRKEQDDAIDRSVDETVERQIEAMPGHKREALGKDLERGVDVELARGTSPC
jgi:ssDNA-binding Zn-finger/Zn-ribbon topoisomerase 1